MLDNEKFNKIAEETAEETGQGQETDEGHGQGGCAAGSLHGGVETE